MTFNQYQTLCQRTSNSSLSDTDQLTNYTLGLAGETGEVVEIVKKYIFHGHFLNREKMIEELGDVLWYLHSVAAVLGIPMDEVAEFNIEKLKNRYKEEFNHEESINREEGICPICDAAQFMTPSGVTCPNGHGGVLSKE